MQGIDGYHLVRRIGAGGMGTVHEALDAEGNRVAVKVLHESIAADPAARDRLRREVELLHRVRGQGVARVLDAEVDGVTAFVVTELVDGPTLEDDVREHGPLDAEELGGLAHGLAAGLRSIHAAGVTHRDLKPGNVMLAPDGPVIIDFGIAQVADDVRLTQTGMVTGTPGYLDPEVLAGADPGPDGDWWAWAAVLTFAATGRPPFGRGTMQAVLGRVSTGIVDTAGLPDDVAAALAAALDPAPERRLPPEELLAAVDGDWDRPALTALLAPPPPSVPRTSVLPSPRPPSSETRVLPPVVDEPYPGMQQPWQAAPQQAWQPESQRPWQPEPQYPAPVQQHPPVQAPPGWGSAAPLEPPEWARPPRRRTGAVAALGLGLSALALVAPGSWLVGLAALLVVLGAVGRGTRRLRAGRLRRGPRRSDAARAWLGAPAHLLWAAGAALPGVLLAVVVAGGGWWAAHGIGVASGSATPALTWAAAAAGLALAWVAPPSASAREGARAVLGGLPVPAVRAVVLAALTTAAVLGVVVLAGNAPDPVWSPLPEPA
ncbi:Serine/threonine protein kinase [Georgenia satyanarayanai]|uniref:Serine/threonine protein kinase n=1 Tax=Georgenia satyanarayanai TaxID=860221 RepID=A0A2Y9A544_9MICO|nr:serine/threonine-protein kinase [Georgenia satyanarayanai]PYG01096.1 serine/threonine protein kinase [Georgenia satyanarayanai]SSA39335.1 Serine/threonine protein kinase [Georgenia satyanarayanai]